MLKGIGVERSHQQANAIASQAGGFAPIETGISPLILIYLLCGICPSFTSIARGRRC